jgi:hypothetical protein
MKLFAINNIEWDILTNDGKHDPKSVPPVDHCEIELNGYDSLNDEETIELLSDIIVSGFHHMHVGFTETLMENHSRKYEPKSVKFSRILPNY